jgi:ribosome biogenesis GTPase A
MPIFLQGLALQNYRGIGPQIQKMAPFREFNFFIGANNSGKSTALNFLRSHLETQENPTPFAPLPITTCTSPFPGFRRVADGLASNR